MSHQKVLFTLLGMILPISAALHAEPDYWDPRLDLFCGLFLEDASGQVPTGSYYWKLIDGRFENTQESGFNHHIYYKCQDASGNPLEGIKTWGSWAYTSESGAASQDTKGAVDGYWGNFGMYAQCPGPPENPCGWPFNAYIDNNVPGFVGPSDKVWGMGMFDPDLGIQCGAHVNFRFIWQWTQAGPSNPELSVTPSGFSRTVTEGDNLPSDSFVVSNVAGGTLAYQITDSASWLSVNPTSGSGQSHDINYTTTGLTVAGSPYNATITITDPNATNSPVQINVQVEVTPIFVPGDFDGDDDVDMDDYGAFQACLSGIGVQLDPACDPAHLDGDVDVDENDMQLFIGCMSGPNVPGDPDCAD